jgi:hypothetical protein
VTPIRRDEILGLAEYETIRPPFRARVIGEKKRRRVAVGPRASLLFENRDTVLMQIQEMLRTERITREAAIVHEIDTYNAFIPGECELSCTLMFEIDDKEAREAFLVAARGIEDAVAIVIGGEKHHGKTTPDRILADRASALIYLKIPIGERGVTALRTTAKGSESIGVAITIEHPAYRASCDLSREVVASLAEDFP